MKLVFTEEVSFEEVVGYEEYAIVVRLIGNKLAFHKAYYDPEEICEVWADEGGIETHGEIEGTWETNDGQSFAQINVLAIFQKDMFSLEGGE